MLVKLTLTLFTMYALVTCTCDTVFNETEKATCE